jgi:hypothetical protein
MARLPAGAPCPSCGAKLDAASSATERPDAPVAGDASVCWYCGVLLVFTSADGAVRVATQSEVDEVLRDYPYLRSILQEISSRAKLRPARDS